MGLLGKVAPVWTSEKFDVFKSVLFSLYSIRHCFCSHWDRQRNNTEQPADNP